MHEDAAAGAAAASASVFLPSTKYVRPGLIALPSIGVNARAADSDRVDRAEFQGAATEATAVRQRAEKVRAGPAAATTLERHQDVAVGGAAITPFIWAPTVTSSAEAAPPTGAAGEGAAPATPETAPVFTSASSCADAPLYRHAAMRQERQGPR